MRPGSNSWTRPQSRVLPPATTRKPPRDPSIGATSSSRRSPTPTRHRAQPDAGRRGTPCGGPEAERRSTARRGSTTSTSTRAGRARIEVIPATGANALAVAEYVIGSARCCCCAGRNAIDACRRRQCGRRDRRGRTPRDRRQDLASSASVVLWRSTAHCTRALDVSSDTTLRCPRRLRWGRKTRPADAGGKLPGRGRAAAQRCSRAADAASRNLIDATRLSTR